MVLWSASVERFSVSRMQDFFYKKYFKPIWYWASWFGISLKLAVYFGGDIFGNTAQYYGLQAAAPFAHFKSLGEANQSHCHSLPVKSYWAVVQCGETHFSLSQLWWLHKGGDIEWREKCWAQNMDLWFASKSHSSGCAIFLRLWWWLHTEQFTKIYWVNNRRLELSWNDLDKWILLS